MADTKSSTDILSSPAWHVSARVSPVVNGDRLAVLMLIIPIVGATFFSKFAVPYVKGDGIGMGFPFIYLSLLLGFLVAGRMRFESTRLLLFCVMASVLGSVMIIRGENISLPSLAFFILLHLPYVTHIANSEHAMASTMASIQRIFLNVATFIALCGLAQYALQFYIAKAYIFPLENFLPRSWLVTGFNMQAPIAYGASIYRPNGIFMQEPSFFSQLLAIAALIELIGPRRLWRVTVFVFGIFASQSGTGLVLLAICVPVLIMISGRWNLIAGLAIVLALLLLASPFLHMEQLIARIGEFGSERSSAYERFVGGFHVLDASVGTDPLRMLFGYGPGTYRDIVHSLDHPAAEMTLFKIAVEYGLVGTLIYFGFMFFCLFSVRGPFVLRLALAVCLFLNGAYNTFVHSLAFALLVWPSLTMQFRGIRNAEQDEWVSPKLKTHVTTMRPSW